jgi:hypothetical protein
LAPFVAMFGILSVAKIGILYLTIYIYLFFTSFATKLHFFLGVFYILSLALTHSITLSSGNHALRSTSGFCDRHSHIQH